MNSDCNNYDLIVAYSIYVNVSVVQLLVDHECSLEDLHMYAQCLYKSIV